MKKKALLIGFAALASCLASFAGTPENMQVWLKNGEYSVFDISQVDSVTFGTSPQQEYTPLTENTMPPTFAAPIPIEVNDQELKYIKSTNEFGSKCFALMRKLDTTPVHFFSPVSLNIALGFCANGATAKGAKEITDAMGFTSEKAMADMNNFFQKLYLSLNSGVDSVDIHTANALWVNEGTNAKENFVNTAKESYYATVRNLDFKNDPLGSKDTIDHWAALMTNDCIKNLGINITSDTRLVINNACYFKGNWVTKFTPVGKALFNGTTKTDSAEFMGIYDKYMDYSETDNFQAIKLDYGQESKNTGSQNASAESAAYSMIVVLPKKGHDLDEVWPTIQWDSIPFRSMQGDLFMPKFKSDGGYDLEKDVLPRLGIKDIFEDYPNAVEELLIYISQVRQDFFISVDEEGTEAAAVTSIVGNFGGAVVQQRFTMTCDHPFAFAIRENRTGLILFMGEYDYAPEN